MILNNYWAWKEVQERAVSSTASEIQTYIKDTAGSFMKITGVKLSTSVELSNNFRLTVNLLHYVSNETTQIDENDYSMNNLSSITDASTSCVCGIIDSKLTYTINISGTNSGSDSITITRVGLLKRIYNTSYTMQNALMAIIELSEPITVPSGNGYSITVEMIEE